MWGMNPQPTILSFRKWRRTMAPPVLFQLSLYRWGLVRLLIGVSLTGMLWLLLGELPHVWNSQGALKALGAVALYLPSVVGVLILVVVPHPLRFTATGVTRWPIVCATWDEIEAFGFANLSTREPVLTLTFTYLRRSARPDLLACIDIPISSHGVERIRVLMMQKGIWEIPGGGGLPFPFFFS